MPTTKTNGSKPLLPPKVKRLLLPLLLAGLCVLVLGGWWLFSLVSEVGLSGLLHMNNSQQSTVHLDSEQSVYKIKKKQQLLGMNVVRIISKQQPEEFLVIDRVPHQLVNSIYGQKVDLVWANVMANQFLKLRENSEESGPISVDIQEIKTVKTSVIRKAGQELPYWQLEVRFKLSNESDSRSYKAGVVRGVGQPQSPPEKPNAPETLVVEYAQTEAFQPELVSDLLDHLSFDQN